MHLCGNPADARDLVQDTFERALRYLAAGNRIDNERAWLFAILHNRFRERCRERSRRPHVDSLDQVELAAPEAERPPAWTAISRPQLEAAIDELDADLRQVYRLHAFEELAYHEIAARLGVPQSTVGTRLLRARRKLREILARLLPEPTP